MNKIKLMTITIADRYEIVRECDKERLAIAYNIVHAEVIRKALENEINGMG